MPRGTAEAAPGESWQVSEPARVEPDPLPFSVDVDLGEYEVLPAAEALASGRAEDLGSLVEALASSARGSADRDDLLARLAAGGPEAAAALVARLPGPSEARASLAGPDPVEGWGPVFAGVVALGRPAEKPLLATLEDPDPERRRAALALLARLGASGALPAIAACVHDEDPSVAAEAALALASARGAAGLAPLVADLRRSLTSGRATKAVPRGPRAGAARRRRRRPAPHPAARRGRRARRPSPRTRSPPSPCSASAPTRPPGSPGGGSGAPRPFELAPPGARRPATGSCARPPRTSCAAPASPPSPTRPTRRRRSGRRRPGPGRAGGGKRGSRSSPGPRYPRRPWRIPSIPIRAARCSTR